MKDRECVQCGSVVQVLSADLSFCLDCDWDDMPVLDVLGQDRQVLVDCRVLQEGAERMQMYMSDDPINLRAYIMASRFNGIDLDGCSVLLGLKREPDENDSVFRSRILSKIRQKYEREKRVMRVIKDGMGR